jgi:hypothetical protein
MTHSTLNPMGEMLNLFGTCHLNNKGNTTDTHNRLQPISFGKRELALLPDTDLRALLHLSVISLYALAKYQSVSMSLFKDLHADDAPRQSFMSFARIRGSKVHISHGTLAFDLAAARGNQLFALDIQECLEWLIYNQQFSHVKSILLVPQRTNSSTKSDIGNANKYEFSACVCKLMQTLGTETTACILDSLIALIPTSNSNNAKSLHFLLSLLLVNIVAKVSIHRALAHFQASIPIPTEPDLHDAWDRARLELKKREMLQTVEAERLEKVLEWMLVTSCTFRTHNVK